ncbi:EAL domain protein [Cellvibrio sp. BR]|jgi:diguanylate cyclase (GGDEF)-like protein/PAS domain S-box-containing protein|uniref:EAL domain-containing response regulator n=1 Tax=Cellvibrio sp. BR TaxID=1134474 RepID=UPI0002600BED|nr:EAL domain-containing protein [Cellvibrio sp. BR]EIK44485.1 EAL domain protein [Cellvibrio sp. BR]
MTSNDTIRLLILNNQRSEAERLISMLHASGHPCRAQHVESEEALVKLLQEQSWDLLIGNMNSTAPTPAIAIKQIRRLNKDVPVILQYEADEDESPFAVVEGLRLGAADVIDLDDDQHLLLVIDRELQNREQRQARRNTDRRFREAERRSQQLLDSSRDAIAFIQDGLYLYANESFAELFGYEDKDEIEAMPIMDMVAKADQARLKTFLKDFVFKGDDAESSSVGFTGLKEDGSETHIDLEVSLVTYDEEPCIQFLARAASAHIAHSNNEELEAQLKQIKWQDVVTGTYNRQYLLNHLEHIIDNVDEKQHSCLFYIELDEFSERIKNSFGVAGADLALVDIATLLRGKAHTSDTIARLGDSTFAIITHNLKADAAVNRAQQLCKDIEGHIIEIDHKTLQVTCSIGISLINETTTSTNTVIEQARQAMEKVRANKGNGAMLFEPDSPKGEIKIDINATLQQALANDRFRLLFQPIISLRGSDEEYYEVYLRMIDESGAEISPNIFFEAASNISACTKIDRWVILESIKMLSQHRAKGNKTKLIVNISRQSLCDESLLPWLAVAFKAAKLSPDAVVFQAQEIDVTNHLNAAKNFADGIKKLNTQFSISNFGCSLNPFNTLTHVAAGMIKVDGSFTSDIQNNNESPETLIQLIEKLNEESKITLVPFVENASVLSTLWQAGAHYIQGHYLQEPSSGMNYDFNMES